MKYALIIGNNQYTSDPSLAQLRTPVADSHALRDVLLDKSIGQFDDVSLLVNGTGVDIRLSISSFLDEKKPDDLVLVYFSGHGIKNARGQLYLATRDTKLKFLEATAIEDRFVKDALDRCRSKRQILILDCCYSGAFARGTKGSTKVINSNTFNSNGFGRVVLTSSNATEFAFEGAQVLKQTDFSLFTHYLLQGLETGGADLDKDGEITLDEWYDYVVDQVALETPNQRPEKFVDRQYGKLVIAKNPFSNKSAVQLVPESMISAINSDNPTLVKAGFKEIEKLILSTNESEALAARSFCNTLAHNSKPKVASSAKKLVKKYQYFVPVSPRILMLSFDPMVDEQLTLLSQKAHWTGSDVLAEKFIHELETASFGLVKPRIEQKISVNEFPMKIDGFRYNVTTYVDVVSRRIPAHSPDEVNYHHILNEYDIVNKINNNIIDEVWIFGFPYSGFYGSVMIGPKAFWCNSEPIVNIPQCKRRFIIMGFSMERGVGEMLHSYGFRADSILERVYKNFPIEDNML